MTHAHLKPTYAVTVPTPGEDAEKITHELMLAAARSGAELNYHASHALYYLQNHLGRKGPDLQHALCLLAALEGVRAPLLCEFTQPAERVLALAAPDAARLFVGRWANIRPSGRATDLGYRSAQQLIRWLRNACHNKCLEADLLGAPLSDINGPGKPPRIMISGLSNERSAPDHAPFRPAPGCDRLGGARLHGRNHARRYGQGGSTFP